MKHLIAIPALILAANTWAACPSQMPAEQPAIPDGSSASHEAMYEAQTEVKSYVASVQSYLACRQEMHPLQRSRTIYLAEETAEAYNIQLATFRKRHDMIATN